jgi:hypothetical protein
MKTKVFFAGIVVLASVFFFQGISMAGVCKKLGVSPPCVTTGDIKKKAVNNARIDNDTIKLNKMDESVAGLNGNGMVKAWARINADGTIASCWRCNTDTNETRNVSAGAYEVDFTPLSTDISGRPRSAVLDMLSAGSTTGMISVADRGGDVSSVFVYTLDTDGTPTNRPFTLIIY